MKHLILTLALLTCSLLGYAQKGISYQAVILDPKPIEIPGQDITGQPFVNGEVSLKFKLFSSTFVQEFEEVHVAKTDAYGLVNVLIGSQNPGAFSALVWDINPRSMQVWVSFDQGGTYTKVSEQVLTYTPYALYAETTGTAGKLSGTLTIGEGGTGAKTAANARTNLGLGNVDNTSDANKPVSIATQNALDAKANELTTYVNNQVAAATIPDADAANKGKIQLAGDLAGTAAAPTVPGLALKADALAVNAALNLKANAVDVANELALKANAAETRTLLREKEIVENKSINVVADADSDSKYPTVKSIKNYVDTQVAGATIADADASTKGKIQLAGDLAGTAAAPTVPGLALKANAADVTTALNTKASTSDLTSGLALKANTADMTAALALKAPLASPTFTGTVTTAAITTGALSSTAVTAPTYASAPRTLTYTGSTINWNPTLGLNAAITLTQNSTLSFTAAPPVGSYGTVVLTQDGTGGRTLTLPTLQGATNQVLGSTSTSTVALSTAASSKDILNFYYDGTVVYWNIGQGYGAASTTNSGPTNLASGVTGTLAVGNGGTGATTLSGLVKGNGSGAMTSAVAGTDYQAPLTLTTTGSGAASLSGTTLNIPSTTNYALPTASASTLGGVKVGSNLSIDGSGVLSANVSAGSISGTVPVANGGTGATTLAANNVLLGNGTSALQVVAPGTTGNVLTSNGTTWTSTAPSASGVPYTGATGPVNLGTSYNLTVSNFTIGQGKTPASGDNLAIGRSALNNTTGNGWPNIGLGSFSLNQTTDGRYNIGIGLNALYANTTGSNNIGIGYYAGRNASTSSNITAVGMEALRNESGAGNTAIGSYAGKVGSGGPYINTTNSTFLGYNTTTGKTSDVTITNSTAIGYGAEVSASNTIQLGNASVTTVKTSGALTAPIYASTPQGLTAGSTINWNPALGLNASVTLNQNSTINFSSTPTPGAYGTLVVTQDGTGGRTLALPTATNKVLGSNSTTTIALSTTASAIDIVNFYYDGSNYFWNVGQGYGSAATAATTNLASSVTGTLPVANGGTGAATLTGYVKGAGTANMTASATIPVADISGTLPVANGGSGTTNGSITGTTALSFAAGGSNQNVSILPSGTGSVGIGTNSPNSSAILDASSTTKGFLPPRMTYAQKMAIASPPQGLMIYCTNCGTNGEPEYYNGVAWVNMAGGPAASVPITLGSTHEGGKVFYIFQPGDPGYVAGETHGLIAAPSDIPSNSYRVFGCRGWPAGTSTALGTGAANTTTLLGCSESNFAAKLVDALTDGGYSDWYLPSKDELNKLYLNKDLVGNFTDWNNTYWSSSEWSPWNSTHSWWQSFSNGTQDGDDKNAQKGIRAIRSF